MWRTIKILILNWPGTRKFSHTVALDFAHHDHSLVTLYAQFLRSDWSKFDRWVYEENLRNILNLVSFDSWSWLSFVPTCDVFNRLFPLDVQTEIQLLSGVFCYSWLDCLLGFWLRNTSLVKVGNLISSLFWMAPFSFLTLLDAQEGWKVWKVWTDAGLTWYLSGAASPMVSLSNYCIWCLFFISNLMKSRVVYAAI